MGIKSFLHKTGEFIKDTKNHGIKKASVKRIGRERRNYYMNAQEAYGKFMNKRNEAVRYMNNKQDAPEITDEMRQDAKHRLVKQGLDFHEDPKEVSVCRKAKTNNLLNLLFGSTSKNNKRYVNVADGKADTLAHELGHAENGFLGRLRNYVNNKFGKSIYDDKTDEVKKESSKIGMLKRYLAEKLDTIEEKAATKRGLRDFLSNYYSPHSKEYKAAEDSLMEKGAFGTYENTRKANNRLMLGNLVSIPTRKTYLEKARRPLSRDEYGDWKFFSSDSFNYNEDFNKKVTLKKEHEKLWNNFYNTFLKGSKATIKNGEYKDSEGNYHKGSRYVKRTNGGEEIYIPDYDSNNLFNKIHETAHALTWKGRGDLNEENYANSAVINRLKRLAIGLKKGEDPINPKLKLDAEGIKKSLGFDTKNIGKMIANYIAASKNQAEYGYKGNKFKYDESARLSTE